MEKIVDITEKQGEFINSATFETLFGGAAGGGKSYGQIVDAWLYAEKYPGSKQLILRRTFPELEKSLIRVALEMWPRGRGKYNQTNHSFLFRNKSIVDFGFCDAENDVYKYQSAEYDVIRFDELTHFTETMYMYLVSRCRGANAFPKRIKSSTNPGNIGHAWVKKRFIDPVSPGEIYDKDGPARTRVFIPALVSDNKFLMDSDPDYVARLEMLPDKDRKALLEGRWDIFEGQYFSMWDPLVHVIKPIEMHGHWRRYATMDYGLDMLAVLWIAVDELGRCYIYRELHEPNLIVSKAIERIYLWSRMEHLTAFYAPPDLWSRHSDTGESTADLFLKAGIPLVRSKNARVAGWYSVAEFLQPYQDGNGKLCSRMKIFENCRNLIRYLPLLQRDEKNPNDCATEPHEITHVNDALRYYCTERPMSALRAAPEDEPLGYADQAREFINWRYAY